MRISYRHHQAAAPGLVEGPGHAVDATDGGVGEHVEGSGGEVEVSEAGATGTSVGNGDDDLVTIVVGGHGLATDGVEVGVGSGSGEGIEELSRGRGDEIGVGVEDSTSTKTGVVEGTIASHDLSRN